VQYLVKENDNSDLGLRAETEGL